MERQRYVFYTVRRYTEPFHWKIWTKKKNRCDRAHAV